MDGLLVVDKPSGITSHDVVARVRRILREPRVGHTGTLDPAATGVLPLVLGRATRLARFLSAGEKSYEAVIRFGFATDTGDADGVARTPPNPNPPSPDAIDRALDEFRGTFLQQPPAYSAKKIAGTRSYKLARANARLKPSRSETSDQPDLPDAVSVTVHRLVIERVEADRVTLSVDCSAGFYVRSLAHDLGERLGVGAHLARLRRTRSGDVTLDDAVALDRLESDPAAAASRVIPMADMLHGLPALVLSSEGLRKAVHGHDVEPGTLADPRARHVRLLDEAGALVGIAERRPPGSALLHPIVVLR